MNSIYVVFLSISILFPVYCYESYGRYSGQKTDVLGRECSIKVKPCTPHEGSRIDGTCNNFKRPSRGSAKSPYLRLLKSDYGNDGAIRQNKDHEPLPSARKVRTMIWSDGRVTEKKMFNRAATHFLEFIHRDISFLKVDYLRNRTHCCKDEGEKDHRCAPIYVPSHDPYLRASGIHCMNYSRAETLQDLGCIHKEMKPEQVNYQTPLLDLSTIYGVDDEALREIRRYEHGLLKEEYRKGRYLPLNETRDVCFNNKNTSNVCYKFGYPEAGNFDLTTTTLSIFFYREHNRIARILHELNPCWKDDRLFKVARQINIATASNILMYELLPEILGHKNMINHHLISEHTEFVTTYDEETDPLVFAEYEIARSFFLTLWDGRIKKYDEKLRYAGEFSLSDTLFKQELIEEDSNFEELNRGTFYQKAGRVDDIIDPDISEKFYAKTFKAHDELAIYIQKGRDLGLHGYNSYRRACGHEEARTFEDLLDVMSEEKVDILKHLYKDLEDVDLLVGIISEDLIPGLAVGRTLFCIMAKQLQVYRFSDRFWFERGKQLHSFTLPQLQEIRKTNMARLACDNAEGIKFIQPRAFISVHHGNDHVACNYIPRPDFTKWKDNSCDKNYKEEHHHIEKPHEGYRAVQLDGEYLQKSYNGLPFLIYGENHFTKEQIRDNVFYSRPVSPLKVSEMGLYNYGQIYNPHGYSTYTKTGPHK